MTRPNRCARIREWLATQSSPASARDIWQAVEPEGNFNAIAASLSAMSRSGTVQASKLGRRLHYTTGRPPPRRAPRATPGPPPPGAALRATIGTLARGRPAMRPAPVTCSLDGISDQQRQASARIAADIAAFEARGGRIERLGPTQFFDRIGMAAANHTPPRRPRTGTHDLDD